MNNDNNMDRWALVTLQGNMRVPVNFRYVQYFLPGTGGHGANLFFVSGDHLQVSDNIAGIFTLIEGATADIKTLAGGITQARAA